MCGFVRCREMEIVMHRYLGRANVGTSVTRKKSPNVYKSCPKLNSLENDIFLTPLQKLPKNVGDLGKLIVAKGFK